MKNSLDQRTEKAKIERLARFLDNEIQLPFIKYRIGWEPIIGLIPGIGDLAGILLSGVIIIQAMRLGTPKTVLLYMVLNSSLEALIGMIPVIGDLFDFFWKANTRNVNLMLKSLDNPQSAKQRSRAMILFLSFSFFLILALIVLGIGLLGWSVWQWFMTYLPQSL